MNNLTLAAILLALCYLANAEDFVPISPEAGLGEYVSYPKYSKSTYKYLADRVTWTEAYDKCNNDGNGAHLIIIDNNDEAVLAGGLFAQISSSGNDLLHVGMTDRVREGAWMTVLNVPVASIYNVWAKGSPNQSRRNNDDCGAINRRSQLTDIPCSSLLHKHPYICERD